MSEAGLALCVRSGYAPKALAESFLRDLQSESVKTTEHFVEFECDDGSRYIHRIVLKIKYPGFDQTKKRVPVSSAIFDHVIEFIYRGETSMVGLHELMDTYKAAKFLDLADFTRWIEDVFEFRMQEFLLEREFPSLCTGDNLKTLATILENIRLDDGTKMGVLQHIAALDQQNSVYKTVLSGDKPPSMYCCLDLNESKNFKLYDAITLDEVLCGVDFGQIDLWTAIVFRSMLFAKELGSSSLLILDTSNGKELQRITMPNLVGITSNDGEIFAWTQTEIYLLKLAASSHLYSPEPLVTISALDGVCVVKRTEEALVFAKQSEDTVELVRVETDGDEHEVVERASGCYLVGNVGNIVYVFFPEEDCFMDLETGEKFELSLGDDLLCRKIANGICYSLVSTVNRDIRVWRTDLETWRTVCTGFVDEICTGDLIQAYT